MCTIIFIITVTTLLCAFGCAKPRPRQMTEEEFLHRYGDAPLTGEGIASTIDDKNRQAGRKDTTDYAQAHETAVTEAMTHLRMLQALDHGETNLVRNMLLTSLNVTTGFIPEYQKRAEISKEHIHEATEFARGYLDYLAGHTNVIVTGRVDFNMALYGLTDLLNDPADLQRLQQLLESLNWNLSSPTSKRLNTP